MASKRRPAEILEVLRTYVLIVFTASVAAVIVAMVLRLL